MANTIRIQKTVANKTEFNRAVDTKFRTFIDPVPDEETDTVEELFRLYNKLYYDIPLEGTNSHTTLIQESSKLVDIERDLTDIQPLLDEITDLRERLLLAQNQIFEAALQQAQNATNQV
jgi:hypothetical protein